MFIYSLIFITLNYFALKISQNNKSFTNNMVLIIFLFLIIAVIGKTYDLFYIKEVMMDKKTFLIMLFFSLGIILLSLIKKYNDSNLDERLSENEIVSNFNDKPKIPVFIIVVTIVISAFQLIIIWNNKKFPID
jgi:ABC-type Mn2+/Zn2+ transport system permease subunit